MATNEETNAAGTDTRPPMLVENDYESWKIRIIRSSRHIFNILNQTSTARRFGILWSSFARDQVGTLQQRKEICARGKEGVCYNCRGEGHVARQCKEPKRKMDSQYFKDKALLMEAKEKGDVLDAEAEAFLADDAYDLDVDEGPNAAIAFMANLSSTSATNNPVNEVHTNDNPIFDNVGYQLSQEMHQEEHLDSDAETEIDDNTIPYHQYLLDTEAQNVPTEVSADTSDKKELSQEQAYWLSANEIARQASKPTTPATTFVHKSRPQFIKVDLQVKFWPVFETLMLFFLNLKFVEQQLVPFYDHFKKHIQAANDTFFKEIKEFEQIFDELEAEYEQCVLDNKNLTIEKKNLLIKNDCLIAECLEKDICSIVLTSDIVVPPSSNCLCEDLRSACDREHTKVLELEAEISKQKQLITESEKRFAFLEQNYVNLQLKFQNYKQCIDTSSASNAIFEINKLRQQLQGKDDTIRNLDAQINIMKVLNVGTTEGSCDQQALETDRIQLKDTITSLRIQLDGLKVENVSLKRRYDELSKANTHSRTAYTEKLSALTAGNNQLKAQVTGKTSSGPSTSETPKVLAPGMYNLGSKYIPPPKRANWVKPTPLPKKKQVTFSEPPRPSLKPTQKPVVHPNKQTNVCVPMSTGVKPTSGASKTVPKRAPQNHSSLPAKSANARRVEAHHRTLNKKNRVDSNLLVKHSVSVSNLNNVCGACNKSLVFANHTDCLVMCDGSVNVKPHQTKRFKRQPKKEWKPIKRVWKPISKPVANSKPQWKPTGRHFSLFEKQVPKGSLVVQIVLWYLDSGCSRHMTGDRARLINFVEKFIGTVRFGNDEYAAIIGYGDYKLGDTIISRVYYVEGLKHNLFSVGQFCDGGLEVAFRQHSCHIRNYDMVGLSWPIR
ncbi:integrase, catalytic region, zinc finger, CCHC-type containing protein [Tanacetum coccineum]